jgi:hypothetical protein
MKTYLKGYRAKRKDKGGKKSSAGLNFWIFKNSTIYNYKLLSSICDTIHHLW